jgi:hypothetical protein
VAFVRGPACRYFTVTTLGHAGAVVYPAQPVVRHSLIVPQDLACDRDSYAGPLEEAQRVGAVQSPRPAAWGVVDTVRVAAITWLLKTPIYTNLVTLQRDTIFILDA